MKNKFFRKAILPSVVALGAAIVSLSSVTYAWFTNGTTAEVQEFTVNVEEAEGLSVGIDNWVENSNTWTSGGFKSKVSYSPAQDFKLVPVSSDGSYANKQMKFFEAEVDPDTQKIKKVNAATTGYITFDLYINNGNGDKNIKISGTTVSASAESVTTGEVATRIGFLNLGTYIGTGFSGAAQTGASTIYEPNNTSHTNSGFVDYQTYSGEQNVTPTGAYKTYPLCGVSESCDLSRYAASANVIADSGIAKTSTEETFFTIPGDKISRIRVYIWLEGQDADCLSDIAAKSIKVKIGLSVNTGE